MDYYEVSNKNVVHTQRNAYTLTAEEKALIRKLVDEDLARLNAENIITFRKNKDQDYSIEELFRKNRKTAEEIYDKYIYYLGTRRFAFAEGYRATIFIDLVKTGGAWDIKSNPLSPRSTYLWRKIYRTGEYIGNYHYGYMGWIIVYNTTQLKIAGGIYQFYGGNFKNNKKNL